MSILNNFINWITPEICKLENSLGQKDDKVFQMDMYKENK